MKKIMSFLLVLVLLASTVVIVNANTYEGTVSQETLLKSELKSLNNKDIEMGSVQKIMDIYNDAGLTTSNISKQGNNLVLHLSENIDESSVENINLKASKTEYATITIKSANDESIVMIIEENGITNELCLRGDGSMWLDGNKVDVIIDEPEVSLDEVTLNGVHYITYTCPYGTASDYSDFRENVNRAINIKKPIADVSTSVLISIVTSGLGNAFKFTVKTAKKIIKAADDNASESTCLSLKRKTYWHKNGYIVNGKGIEKWVTKYYYKINYQGYAGTDTKYEVYG